jgi:hypothetical protein
MQQRVPVVLYPSHLVAKALTRNKLLEQRGITGTLFNEQNIRQLHDLTLF